ncbi:hypothetical protein N7474_008749 [Penicillium riverlandense]|uniref:uncharacterized protein n=1 Tax=Penicillium riverlandense TaxID=1903569 RepID=UPI0025480C0A|nr:uncharacterized protein N7474_008749 [Penicillium riverlandense]KAJ5812448.1 hypothetical protein N7474_008749 [Penicillium riverlandense]
MMPNQITDDLENNRADQSISPAYDAGAPNTDVPPANKSDGGYGWVCVVAMLLITAHTWGVNGAFGVYLAHYLDSNTFPGTSELTYSFIGGLSISQITFIAPLVTKCVHTFGTRPTLLVGVVLETGGLIAASFATKVWHLFLTQGLLFGWGSSFLYVGAVGIVPQWFEKRKSVANGIAAGGSGLGGLIWSLATSSMIQNLGLPWAFRITAICVFVVNITCAFLMRDRNSDLKPNQHSFDLSLFKRYEFVLLVGWAYFSTLGYTIILFSLPDNAVKVGLTSRQGAIVGALANLGMAIGRPTIGLLSDYAGRINVATGATFLSALYCLCIWTSGNSYAVLIVFAVLGGSVFGTYWATIGPLLNEVLGIRLLPAALSIVWTVIVLPTTFAEPIALELRRRRSPYYLDVEVFSGCVFIAGTLCLLALRQWKIRMSDRAPDKVNGSPDKPTRLNYSKIARALSTTFTLRKV